MQFSTIVYKLLGIALVATPVALITSRVAAEDLSFYDTPSAMPAHNGDIVRSEPSTFYLDPARLAEAPANVQRIMYRSTDRFDSPIAVTGTVLTPTNPWAGVGQRPVVAFNVGTQGLGDHCAPSRQLAAGTEYEGGFLSGLLARGYGVVVTDYEGLGTPGVHSYLSREVTGRAVLDGIRAAQRLPEGAVPPLACSTRPAVVTICDLVARFRPDCPTRDRWRSWATRRVEGRPQRPRRSRGRTRRS